MAKVTPPSTQLIIAFFYVFLHGTASVDGPNNQPIEEIGNSKTASPKSRVIHDFVTYTSAYKILDSKDTKCYLERMYQKVDLAPKKDIHRVLFTTHKLLTKREVWVLGGARISEFCRSTPTFLLQHRNAYWQREEQIIAYKTLEDAKCFIINLPLGKSFDPLHNTNFTVSSSVKLSKQALWDIGGSKIVEFCNGFTSYALQQEYDKTQQNMIRDIPEPKNNRLKRLVKRSALNSNNYKLKSQTQTQYMNIGGTSQEPGKAEAEASRDGTKAVVIGSTGMGQAQSQSGPWSCTDCYGQDDAYQHGRDGVIQDIGRYRRPGQADRIPSTESRPSDIGTPYTQTGGQGIIDQFRPSGLRPVDQMYPIGPGDYGRPGDISLEQPGQQEWISTGRQGATGTGNIPGSIIGSPGSYQRPGTIGGQTAGAPEFPGTYRGPSEVVPTGVYTRPGQIYQSQPGIPAGIPPGSSSQPDTTGRLPQTIPDTFGQPGIYTGQGGVELPGVFSRPGAIQQGLTGTPRELSHIIPGTSDQSGTPKFPGTHSDPDRFESPGSVSRRPGTVQPSHQEIPGRPAQIPITYDQTNIPRFPATYNEANGLQQGRPGTPGIYPGGQIPVPSRLPGIYDERPGTHGTIPSGKPGIYRGPGTYEQGQPGDNIISQPGILGTYYPSGSATYQKGTSGTIFDTPGTTGITYGPGTGDITYPQGSSTSGQQGTYHPDISGPGVGTQYPGGINIGYPQRPGSAIQLPPVQYPGTIGQTSTGGYDQSGEFSGKVSGDYHTNRHRGQFSGVISGQYSGSGRTGLTGSGPSGTEHVTGLSGVDYPTNQGKYPGQGDGRGATMYYPEKYPGTKPQTYGQDIIYPTGPNGRPGISTHPDHELLPAVQYSRPGTPGVRMPEQIYQPHREDPLIPGIQQPGQGYGNRGIIAGEPGSVITGRPSSYYPGQALRPGAIDRSHDYIPGQRPSLVYNQGQESRGISTGGITGPGNYISGQGPSGIIPNGGYISAQGPIGGTGSSAKVPTHIGRPSEYISGQSPLDSRPMQYVPGQGITETGIRPGGITYTPDRGSHIYIPGQDGRPGISVPGTQIPGGITAGSYIPGQSSIQTPGLAPGISPSGEYIPSQGSIGPTEIRRPGEQYLGQISVPRPGDGYYRPDEVLVPGQRKPGPLEVSTGILYKPGESNDAGRYYGKPGGETFGGIPSGIIGPDDYSGVQPGTGQYAYPGVRVDQLELLPGSAGYIPGSTIPEDDSNTQVQTSVQQINNETQASASSQGKFLGGTAQSQVSGTYSGSGAFSASAGTIDQHRGAQTQVSGGAEGAISSAQGRGGVGQSQAQIQLSSKTGDTTSSAQSGGVNYSTNTQVQAGGKGGMADAQANGKGSTSSQANIGFSPYDADDGEENRPNGNRTPFNGGGTASAQSGSNAGQSQAQINGKYRFGIKYTGSAQSSSSNDGKTFPLRNDSTSQMQDFKLFDFNKSLSTFPIVSTTQTPINVTTPRVSTAHNKRSGAVDYIEEDDEPDEEYEEDYIETESKKKVIIPINSQHTRAHRQHVSLGKLEDLDATIIQTIHDNAVYQPGQIVPGTEFAIPSGLRGRVLSTSGQETYSQGSNSQAQTFHLNPGNGKVTHIKPPIYAVTSNTHLRNGEGYGSGYTYQPQYQLRNGQSYPRFVSSTKSETGSKNVITGKKTPSVYYSQSSTCGYFTNNCVFSQGKKVCIPKPKLNPDGTPMIC